MHTALDEEEWGKMKSHDKRSTMHSLNQYTRSDLETPEQWNNNGLDGLGSLAEDRGEYA